jgi:leucyl aminopeptidase (aminopeptidase T)
VTEVTAQASETQTPSPVVWGGVSSFLDQYAAVQPGDEIYILYTSDARDSAAWVSADLTVRGITPNVVGMNAETDDGLEARLRGMLPRPDAVTSRLVLMTIEKDSMSHSLKLRRILAPYDESKVAVFRLINASAEFFEHAVNVTPQLLSAINGGLLNRMMPASRLHIQSSSGTDLDVSVDSARYRWLSNRGIWREGTFVITPSGEVSTFPADINGTFVADGAFNVTAYTKADARLHDNPVTLQIEHGRVVSYSCPSPTISRFLAQTLARDNADRIGELGFGTNIGISEFIPMNSHINERRPGVHLGLGQHGQKIEVVPYLCDIHLDLITSDATITVDSGEVIRSDRLMEFSTSTHPPIVEHEIDDQDIDGDCCGVIAREVAKAKEEYAKSCSLDKGESGQEATPSATRDTVTDAVDAPPPRTGKGVTK